MDKTIPIPKEIAFDEYGRELKVGDHMIFFDVFGNPPQDKIYILERYEKDQHAYIGRECVIH